MTVYEIITLFVEEDKQYFEVWSNNELKRIFEGYLAELPKELEDRIVTSIDNVNNYCKKIVLNIS